MIPSSVTWALVADAEGARIFSFLEMNSPWTLHDTIAGDGSGQPDQTADFGPKASMHKGALHGHGQADGTGKETRERRFAHTLAHVLEKGFVARTFGKLVLVAPPRLLGELRENLSRGLQGAVAAELHKDYTHSSIEELRKLIMPSLQS